MQLTVVILNFNRPNYIKNNIIPFFKNKVSEIIVSHGKKETEFTDPGIVSLKHYGKMNYEYGLSLRFLSSLEAKNENIMILDDDIIPSEKTLNFLYRRILDEPSRIHGIYGRDIRKGYSIENCFGDVPIVLTRCLATTKTMCKYYIENFRNFESDLVKKSKPYWNGEDILFSLLSVKKNNKLNKAYDLSHNNRWLNYLDFSSISLTDNHLSYRENVTEEFVKKLELKDKISKKVKIDYKRNQLTYFIHNSDIIYLLVILIIIFSYLIIKKYIIYK